MQVRRML